MAGFGYKITLIYGYFHNCALSAKHLCARKGHLLLFIACFLKFKRVKKQLIWKELLYNFFAPHMALTAISCDWHTHTPIGPYVIVGMCWIFPTLIEMIFLLLSIVSISHAWQSFYHISLRTIWSLSASNGTALVHFLAKFDYLLANSSLTPKIIFSHLFVEILQHLLNTHFNIDIN